jgi:tRNA(adenine34) deaminase
MARALELAKQAQDLDEVPVGAVLVHGGEIIAEGINSPIQSNDPSAHAEINALRQAGKQLQNYRFPNSTLYVTLEPCSMCAGALVHARVTRVVIAAREPRAGAGGSVLNVLCNPSFNHSCQVEYGLMEQESANLLKLFFKHKREIQKLAKQNKGHEQEK